MQQQLEISIWILKKTHTLFLSFSLVEFFSLVIIILLFYPFERCVSFLVFLTITILTRTTTSKIMGCVSTKKKLSKADLEFLEENTEFTKDQIIEWYEGFIVSTKRRKNQKSILMPTNEWERERERERKTHLLPLTYTSNNHMVHRHCEIAFPVWDYLGNWLMFASTQDLHLPTHAFLPIVRFISLMIGHAKRNIKPTTEEKLHSPVSLNFFSSVHSKKSSSFFFSSSSYHAIVTVDLLTTTTIKEKDSSEQVNWASTHWTCFFFFYSSSSKIEIFERNKQILNVHFPPVFPSFRRFPLTNRNLIELNVLNRWFVSSFVEAFSSSQDVPFDGGSFVHSEQQQQKTSNIYPAREWSS